MQNPGKMTEQFRLEKIHADGASCCLAFAPENTDDNSVNSLAGSILSIEEKIVMNSFNPKRRIEWLLGRLNAKNAVIGLLKDRNIKMKDAVIKSTREAAPKCYVNSEATGIFLSISHSRNHAVAAASVFPVGVDIEFERRFTENLQKIVFNEDDRLDGTYTSMWCAKEAVAKALGLGTMIDFRRIKLENGNAAALWSGKRRSFGIEIKKVNNLTIAIAKSDER